MTHASCKLNTQVYKHTLGIFQTYCFSIVTVFTQTRVKVTSDQHATITEQTSAASVEVTVCVDAGSGSNSLDFPGRS
jgi:hypothetical protein